MDRPAFFAVIFGIPILLYVLWLARLRKQCPFLGLLIIAVVAVWIALWPVHFGPEYRRVSHEMVGDRADGVMTGFMLMGWFPGAIGCLPILFVEIPRSIVLLMRSRRASRISSTSAHGQHAAPSDSDKPSG